MERVFSLGSEWVYFKIYTGYKTADLILLEYLKEKIDFLIAENHIKKWFFIRYYDTDSHLRLRFQVNNPESVYVICKELNPIFQDVLNKNYCWKIQNDTYLREVERYGLTTIEDSETLFYFDSKMMLEYLSFKNSFENEATQLFFSFLSINSFLNAFSLPFSEKLTLLNEMQLAFKQEFNATKVLKSQLDKHYRSLENDIVKVLNYEAEEEFQFLYAIIEEKLENSKPVANAIKEKLEINLHSFLSSHIHMMINRQFTSRQREYEVLIYDHLYRYYKMCFYRNDTFKLKNVKPKTETIK